MGGWCRMRDSCGAHTAAVGPADTINERLCIAGRDGHRIEGGLPMVLFVGAGWQLSRDELLVARRVEARSASDPLAAMGW